LLEFGYVDTFVIANDDVLNRPDTADQQGDLSPGLAGEIYERTGKIS
jgi:hypothetical protein